ncbi:zinc-binding dehydrogenase [Providencia sp. wls1919]|nr:zinc-binding dehydrogenase [Providencia sp. wls1919]
MKAAVIHQFGGPEEIKYEELKMPQPGSGEVLVKTLAIGTNRLDHYVRLGEISPDITFPHVLGSDAIGQVINWGKDVTGFNVGDRVISMPGYPLDPSEVHVRPVTVASSYAIPGVHTQGTYAEYIVVPAQWLLIDNTDLPVEQIAALPVPLLIAIRSVEIVGEVKAGDTVLVQAGASSTGMMSIQVAKALCARVVTTVQNSNSVETVKEFGADFIINTSEQDFVSAIHEWTEGKGVDVAIDNLGGDILQKTINVVRPEGIIVSMGFMAGTQATIDVRNFFFTQKQLRGTLVGDIEDFSRWLPAIKKGLIRPLIDSTMPLSQAANAHERIANNQARGAIILIP